jgi:hypothetical protein
MRRLGKSPNYLFSKTDLQRSLDATIQALRNEVDAISAERFLNTAHADLSEHLVNAHRVDAVQLLRDQIYASESEAKIDVSQDHSRWIEDRTKPFYRPGQRIIIHVPFAGEACLLDARPNTYTTTLPIADIMGSELIFNYGMPEDAPRDVKAEVDSMLGSDQISAHNAGLRSVADTAINKRRQRLLVNSQRLASLGIPVRTKSDAPATYTIPTVRKKAAAPLPAATATPFEPEPAWAMDQYEHALKVIQQMTLVMERSPSAFSTMDEEALRQHFLVQLNGQFEGRATGETFNLNGKTDILLREGSRNAFIAECKFWKGPKKFGEAIEQLLGYTAWRDSKTAILVFNRGTSTSTVLSSIKNICESHANLKRAVNWPHESGFRYVFHQNEDRNREFILTVLVFDVPA